MAPPARLPQAHVLAYTGRMNIARSAGRVSANWLIVIAALAAAAGLWFGARLFTTTTPAPLLPPLQAGMAFPAPREVPAFELDRADGGKLSQADWRGRWTIVFFGYTHCPDICPTTLASFGQAWKKLDAAARERLRFDFISVDPARDNPEQLARYVGHFDKDFVGATGSDEQLTALTRALGIMYAREQGEAGSYTVDHSASVLIIDPAGREVGLLRPPFDASQIAADLQTLARSQ